MSNFILFQRNECSIPAKGESPFHFVFDDDRLISLVQLIVTHYHVSDYDSLLNWIIKNGPLGKTTCYATPHHPQYTSSDIQSDA